MSASQNNIFNNEDYETDEDYIQPRQADPPYGARRRESSYSPLPISGTTSNYKSNRKQFDDAYSEASNFEGNRNETPFYTQRISDHYSNEHNTKPDICSTINEALPELIPLLIQLLFANTTTKKIEIVSSIAKCIGLTNQVLPAIKALNLAENI